MLDTMGVERSFPVHQPEARNRPISTRSEKPRCLAHGAIVHAYIRTLGGRLPGRLSTKRAASHYAVHAMEADNGNPNSQLHRR
jgi:hypothetical protein